MAHYRLARPIVGSGTFGIRGEAENILQFLKPLALKFVLGLPNWKFTPLKGIPKAADMVLSLKSASGNYLKIIHTIFGKKIIPKQIEKIMAVMTVPELPY